MTTTFGSRPRTLTLDTRQAPSGPGGTQTQTTAGFPYASVDSQHQQRVMVQGAPAQNFTEVPGSLALNFDKSHLNMTCRPGEDAFDHVTLTNVGSTTVHYEWRRVRRPDFIEASHTDQLRRFYCYSPPGTLKPGECRTFTITFRSEKVGIFFEEWEVVPDPHFALNPLPLLCLSGTAKAEDELVEERAGLEARLLEKQKSNVVNEALEDMIGEVRTQESEIPDARDPAHFRRLFEENNSIQGLYWTEYLQARLPGLVDEILAMLGKQPIEGGVDLQNFHWDGSISQLEGLLLQIADEFDRWLLTLRLRQYVAYARSKPLDSATSYGLLAGLLGEVVEKVPGIVTRGREEANLWEYTFEIPPDEGYTPEQQQARDDALKQRKAVFYKQKKLKPRTEEEEEKDIADARDKMYGKLGGVFMKAVDGIERKTAADEAIAQLEDKSVRNALSMSVSQWLAVSRKFGIMDVDFEGRNVLLRADLDIELEPVEPAPSSMPPESRIPGQASGPSSTYQMQSVGFTTGGGDMDTNRSGMQESLPSEIPRQASQPQGLLRQRQLTNPRDLGPLVSTIKYCLDRMANRVFVIGNLGPRSGSFNHDYSMKPIHSALTKMIDQPVVFYEHGSFVENFQEKLQNDELPENTVYVMENLNFAKEEFGFANVQEVYEEAAPPPDAPEDPDAPTPEPLPPIVKRRVKTFYASEDELVQFSRQLSVMADVYVNEAPTASTGLLRTNSMVNISANKRVMGVQLTEAVRKLSYFFIYPSTKPTLAVLGGSGLRAKMELLNGLLDYNTPDVARQPQNYLREVYLMGRVGLETLEVVLLEIQKLQGSKAAQYPAGSLGWPVRPEEMAAREAVVLNVLAKARRCGVRVVLPWDFQILGKPDNWEDLVSGKVQEEVEEAQEESKAPAEEEPQPPRSRKNTTMLEQGFTSKRTEESKVVQPPVEEIKRKRPLLEWMDAEYPNKVEVCLPRRLADPIAVLQNLQDEQAAPIHMDEQGTEEDPIEKAPPVPSVAKRSKAPSSKQEPPPDAEATITPVPPDDGSKAGDEVGEDAGRMLNPEDVVLEYGPQTIQSLKDSAIASGKVLWDGSLSCYGGTESAGDNNKQLVEVLQIIRENNQDYEVTRVREIIAIHDSDGKDQENSTLVAFKEGAERLRQEQISMRNTRTSSAMDGESGGFDETSYEDQGGSSLASKDLANYSDVAVLEPEVTSFTCMLMSGRMIPAFMDMSEHQALQKEEVEEDLSILEDI